MDLGAVLGVWDFGPWGGWVGGLVGYLGNQGGLQELDTTILAVIYVLEKCVFFFFLLLFLLCFWCLSRHVATMKYLCYV